MKLIVLKKSVLILIVFCVGLLSCNDDPPKPDDKNNDYEKTPLIFESLTAEKDTITVEETTKVTAIATGKDIKYNWTVSSGGIVGSGYIVTITTVPCIIEDINVTCVVKDAYNQSKSKSIKIVVK